MSRTEFMRSFGFKTKFTWSGLSGYRDFGNGKVARIFLERYGEPTPTYGHQNGFRVVITSKDAGVIDEAAFFFKDYFDRNLYLYDETTSSFQDRNGLSWRTNGGSFTEPPSVTGLINDIEAYLDLFRYKEVL